MLFLKPNTRLFAVSVLDPVRPLPVLPDRLPPSPSLDTCVSNGPLESGSPAVISPLPGRLDERSTIQFVIPRKDRIHSPSLTPPVPHLPPSLMRLFMDELRRTERPFLRRHRDPISRTTLHLAITWSLLHEAQVLSQCPLNLGLKKGMHW
uniref:Uncharacterized protein n=1 Tax=Knipowitschia caucasica TaxID=637954 RepID=A0AAV2LMW0_KNICA